MTKQAEIAKRIEEKICDIHQLHPCLGSISNVIPVLTCCREFKERLQAELTQQYGEEFVQKVIRLT